jgi:NAD(P)-dependent dehydrogenase (short-subunit alcohol dehydrogenase family)
MAFSVSFAVVVLSLVLGPNGIAQTTNGLITGTVLDPTGAAIPRATITVRNFAKMIPLGRVGNAMECAKVIVFLASDAASYIVGESIELNGGQLML